MKNLLFHPLTALLFTVIAILFVVSLRKTAQKSEVSSKNVEVLEEKINQLSGEIEAEQQALEYASSKLAREKMLRNELLLQKPGEYILQIPNEESLNVNQNVNEEQTNLKTWWELIF